MYNFKQSDWVGFIEKLTLKNKNKKHEGGEAVTQAYARRRNILDTANTK